MANDDLNPEQSKIEDWMAGLIIHNRFHRLNDITLQKMRRLDRAHTVVLLPMGMVEEHGNHLPLGTDNYSVDALVLAAAASLLESNADLHILLLPAIPYGTDPVDLRRPELFASGGSIWISRETLKQIVADITQQIVRYGFHQFFPINYHGGPDQNQALMEICTEMRETYPGLVMYEPVGHVLAGAEKEVKPGIATLLGRPMTSTEQVALQGSIHASMFETSVMLNLQPKLVDPSYKSLRTVEWHQMFQDKEWPGYVGAAPAHANAEIGGAVLRWRGVRTAAVIQRALGGEDLTELPRHPRWANEDPDEAFVPEPQVPDKPVIESRPALVIPAEIANKVRAEKRQTTGEKSDPYLEDTVPGIPAADKDAQQPEK